MTKEEKVMFLMRLAVDTHSAFRAAQIASPRSNSISRDPMNEIEEIYVKYEEFLDKKLESGSW
ncbi:hypothetical protein [Kluyvera sp. Awk 3]|uniref:hypothetical protein n=1 Tax=Kluyvera sp. Awk 3 TaxID=2963956 RepID=UPI002302C729|nr:hypothetical protein [Kluyvera sp. Awk 3]MDA8487442.1 hypothetical protein [Kluyvera sp. Awk 3]